MNGDTDPSELALRLRGWRLATAEVVYYLPDHLPRLLFNDHLNITLTALFLVLTWVLVLDTLRVCSRVLRGLHTPPFSEVPYARTELAA